MSAFWPILIVVLGLIYIASPWDFLPDVFPITGWIDDIGIMAVIFYYLRTGRLPDFVYRIVGWLFGRSKSKGDSRQRTGGRQHNTDDGHLHCRQAGTKNPYEVLGVSPEASSEEIHKAYRRLVQQYHPDKVSHLGEEFRELAQQKFVEIQAAYEQLTGRTG